MAHWPYPLEGLEERCLLREEARRRQAGFVRRRPVAGSPEEAAEARATAALADAEARWNGPGELGDWEEFASQVYNSAYVAELEEWCSACGRRSGSNSGRGCDLQGCLG